MYFSSTIHDLEGRWGTGDVAQTALATAHSQAAESPDSPGLPVAPNNIDAVETAMEQEAVVDTAMNLLHSRFADSALADTVGVESILVEELAARL